MSAPIITVENLSKRYHLGQIGATTLRDSAERFIHRLADAVKTKRFEQKPAKDAKGGGSAEGDAAGVLNLKQIPAGAASSPLPPLRSLRPSVQDSSDTDDLWAMKDVKVSNSSFLSSDSSFPPKADPPLADKSHPSSLLVTTPIIRSGRQTLCIV